MFRRSLILIILALAICLAASTAVADWDPSDGWNMHFAQLPSVFGWDVNATSPTVLADDWTCAETGWIRDIHFWGAWKHGSIGQVAAFQLSIYADIPANPPEFPYGRPGALLWERQVSEFMIALPDEPLGPGGWHDPSTGAWFPEDHSYYFQYNVFLDEPDWFWQSEGTTYWLAISAVVADPGQTQWGWKSTMDHWSDAAVWAFSGEYFWIDTWEPPDYMQSLDLAFVITSGDVCDAIIIGDANDAGGEPAIDIDDVVFLIDYIFVDGDAPTPYTVASGDANCSCYIDIDDIMYLIAYIFSGGPPPCTCGEWISLCGALH